MCVSVKPPVNVGRNLNLAKPFFNECRLEHLRRRNEAVDEGFWTPVENLGTHTDVVDLGGRIERLDVRIDPCGGRCEHL
ncbi:hypothetical protein L2E82_29575 [Cichorium intybus]|uniref:Uncharacterized protein n=1 Tax=Cichorium intybus TaxID=13427 RepID=A0ACB9CXV7_CICIN|nr:hypothetical protein L2E82_29575 [Cichorium intybus]